MTEVLAVDMGGTRIKVAVVHGRVVVGDVVVLPSPGELPSALRLLEDVAARLVASGVGAVGLAVPGLVDEDGRVVALPGKYAGIERFDLCGWSAERIGAPAVVANDAIAFAVGEAAGGAGRGARRLLGVTIGTGVGVAVVEDGRPVSAGPLGGGIVGGAIPLEPVPGAPEHRDTSGRAGTLEALCRAQRIVDLARGAGTVATSPAEVLAAARAGDQAARQGLARYREQLARALAVLVIAHGADVAVIGGGPLSGPEWSRAFLLDGVEEQVRAHLWPTHRLSLRAATLGDASALVGIAALADGGSAGRPTVRRAL